MSVQILKYFKRVWSKVWTSVGQFSVFWRTSRVLSFLLLLFFGGTSGYG
jgi:hypothetical protein